MTTKLPDSDEELVELFLITAKEMGKRGRKVWEDFFTQLVNDDSDDAEEALEWLSDFEPSDFRKEEE